jgi:hypothetical protein
MSCCRPPSGAIVGEIPVKEIMFLVGSTKVMVAEANRVVSVFDVATTVTDVEVGKEVGAVYLPLASMLPQPGLQEAAEPEMVVACVTSQVTPAVSLTCAEKVKCSGVMLPAPAAIVAVAGLTADTRIPESRVMVAVPIFFVLAADVAVRVKGAAGVVEPAAGTSALGTVAGAV